LQAALRLRRAPVEVTLVDRQNFHLFQPLTYQVATGALSPGEIAYPLRSIFRRDSRVRVLMGEVSAFDLQGRRVHLAPAGNLPALAPISYDTLIVAGGSRYSYFGHDEWGRFASEVKSLESALLARGRILSAFEAAELEPDADRRAAWLTFIVVGGGPTGVEMAGQIAELARDTLGHDFQSADPRGARIFLVEAMDRLLVSFPPSLSERAERSLVKLGVEPLLGRTVVGVDQDAVTIEGAGGAKRLSARTVIWAAGVTASPLAAMLAEGSGAELGDMVRVRRSEGTVQALPGLAPVAMQQGRYVANLIRARLRGEGIQPFRYTDKGSLATIGRAAAVADLKGLRLSGLIAWITWVVVHLWYLIGFQNRVLVFIRWSFSFVTHGRGARLITDPERGALRPSAAVRQGSTRPPGPAPQARPPS
jgi:NADH:quinone reductase (non-electrogenic)